MKKLTYAPYGLEACKDIMLHYNAYDLQKIQKSLNEAIISNHPDRITKNVMEVSEILDNIWNDKTIPQRVKGLQIGVPLSMAALGSIVSGPIGTMGFLVGLGFSTLDKIIDLGTEGLSEKIAKFRVKNYQANIYEFKKEYKSNLVREKHNSARTI